MITISKTPIGYTVNGRLIGFENDSVIQPNDLNIEEEIALNYFLLAEKNGIKIQQSCVTVK
jgi:hypothetical protein